MAMAVAVVVASGHGGSGSGHALTVRAGQGDMGFTVLLRLLLHV